MRKLCLNGAKFLYKHKALYWILQFTWGIIGTLIGFIVILFLKLCGEKIKLYHRHPYIIFGNNWGGLELGCCFLVADKMSKDYTLECMQHEAGHNYQNAILGPFVIFLVAIPSACRYWYDRLEKKHAKERDATDWYSKAWFEGNADEIGQTLYKENENNGRNI